MIHEFIIAKLILFWLCSGSKHPRMMRLAYMYKSSSMDWSLEVTFWVVHTAIWSPQLTSDFTPIVTLCCSIRCPLPVGSRFLHGISRSLDMWILCPPPSYCCWLYNVKNFRVLIFFSSFWFYDCFCFLFSFPCPSFGNWMTPESSFRWWSWCQAGCGLQRED